MLTTVDPAAALAVALREALEALPDDPDQIADYFAAIGIVGQQAKAGRCPLARYLTARCDATEASVTHTLAVVYRYDPNEYEPIRVHSDRIPGPVARFVLAFDSGEYPFLVDPQAAS